MRRSLWVSYAAMSVMLCVGSSGIVRGNGCTATFEPNKYCYKASDNPLVTIGTGTTHLNSDTYTITADTGNIEVVLCGDAILEGQKHTQLRFVAHSGYTVTVKVDHEFSLLGKSNDSPLLVTFGGLGSINFEITGGQSVNFGADRHPVKAFVLMDDACYGTNEKPTLSFKRYHGAQCLPTASVDESSEEDIKEKNDAAEPSEDVVVPESDEAKDVVIAIHKGSLLSYLSQQNNLFIAEDKGRIVFDPSNVAPSDKMPCPGTMLVRIHDGGALVTAGHWVKIRKNKQVECDSADNSFIYDTYLYKQKFTLHDIKLSVAAGHKAVTRVKVALPECKDEKKKQGGLRVENANSTLSELLSDPFCHLQTRTDKLRHKGAFNGIRLGFVLGANGVLAISDETFLDYIALEKNVCPTTLKSVEKYDDFSVSAKRLLKERNGSAFIVDGNNNPDACPAEIRFGKHAGLFLRSGYLGNSCDYGVERDYIVDPLSITRGVGNYVLVVEAPLNVYGKNNCDKENSKIEVLSLQVSLCGGELFHGDDRTQFPARTFNRHPAPSCGDYERFGGYLTYNKAACLINDTVNIYKTSLVHTDALHHVLEKNDILSEPTYVGGEKWKLGCGQAFRSNTQEDESLLSCEQELLSACRPSISLFNSRLDIHSDIAFTGVDVRVPNLIGEDNKSLDNCSALVFYQNGMLLDNGFGRNMILGTQIGATACDDCTVINRDAHLDVIQLDEGDYCSTAHILSLETAANKSDIIECVKKSGKVSKQPGVNSIYLGHNSNISVGSHVTDCDDTAFECGTTPTLFINGNYFAISARGGSLCDPNQAHITGQGGIFVDQNGLFGIGKCYRASINAMVTRSMGGFVDLPSKQVTFGPLVGIADWKLNLTDDMQQVVVDCDESIAHYIFNWIGTTRDYKGNAWYNSQYRPYRVPSANICDSVKAKQENITALANVRGTVNEFQIQGSRIGDEAQLLVDGGTIKELVFAPTNHSGEIPAAVVVLKNNGSIGLGSLTDESDSVYAASTLGIDGVTIIADGSGHVELNHDMVIANRCVFVKGPHFVSGTDVLDISSNGPRTIRVTSTGILDFQSFDDPRDIVRFGGQIHIVMEPGSSIVMGGGVLQIANDSVVVMEPSLDDMCRCVRLGREQEEGNPLVPVDGEMNHNKFAPLIDVEDDLKNTDAFRVKIQGQGTLQMIDDARLFIDKGAFVGIETYVDKKDIFSSRIEDALCCDNDKALQCTFHKNYGCSLDVTDITIELKDNALFSLGGDAVDQGGSLQIGNTEHRVGHDVQFNLVVNGLNAQFFMGEQAFLGLNSGIVRRCATDKPNNWLIDVLHDVSQITIDIQKGLFSHAQIYAGDDARAHLMVIGQNNAREAKQVLYSLLVPPRLSRVPEANIHGGGNLVLLRRGAGAFHPIVLDKDGAVDVSTSTYKDAVHRNMQVGILASRALLGDKQLRDVSAAELFENSKTAEATQDAASRDANLGNAAIDQLESSGITTELRVGYVDRGMIGRASVNTLLDIHGGENEQKVERAADIGAVYVKINVAQQAPGALLLATQIA
ncbi:MAG: hypothetical protein NT124_02720 [Candidatus Dependentiae bacterium]|nr:hypothetical protein [Candidatus Dependentiae bacterium]